MDGADSVNNQPAAPTELRRHPRFVVDGDSALVFTDIGLTRQCKIIDLSLEGCRLTACEPIPAKVGTRVEIAFKVKGMAFRFNGVLRWTDGRKQAGIQFIGMIQRCRLDLADLIGEFQIGEEQTAVPPSPAQDTAAKEPGPESSQQPSPTPTVVPPGPNPERPKPEGPGIDRRLQVRHPIDTSATIILVRGGVPLSGRILDLSLGGCRVRTEKHFPVGTSTPVETEFQLRGLPFRLGGVIQAIHSPDTVGVRFLDMSDRKLQQVSELIAEIEQARQPQNTD